MIHNEVPNHESSSNLDQLDRQVFGWATSAFTCQSRLSKSLTVIMPKMTNIMYVFVLKLLSFISKIVKNL